MAPVLSVTRPLRSRQRLVPLSCHWQKAKDARGRRAWVYAARIQEQMPTATNKLASCQIFGMGLIRITRTGGSAKAEGPGDGRWTNHRQAALDDATQNSRTWDEPNKSVVRNKANLPRVGPPTPNKANPPCLACAAAEPGRTKPICGERAEAGKQRHRRLCETKPIPWSNDPEAICRKGVMVNAR
jgi:hypothetical protein